MTVHERATLHLLIIEDHAPTRERLVSLFDGTTRYTVTAALESTEQALEFMVGNPPDVVILDLGLPGISGAEAVEAINCCVPATEILIYTVMDEEEQVFASLRAGACGYILKEAPPAQVMAALDELQAGGAPMSLSIARKVLREFQSFQKEGTLAATLSPLSRRETEILELLYQGRHDKGIADALCLSTHTVHAHIKSIYRKLHVNSRAQAIHEAINQHFIKT